MNAFSAIHRRIIYLLTPICPRLCCRYLYRRAFGRRLNLNRPVTLNEKIIWLNLNCYGTDALVSQCADKFAVREYVERCGCSDILNELYGVWDNAAQIDYAKLPDCFVLKCTHGSGYNLICKSKRDFDTEQSTQLLNHWLSLGFWRFFAELQYRAIRPRIISERLLADGAPTDYKVYCFHGAPKYVLVCVEREKGKPRFFFFDTAWNFCPITRDGMSVSPDFTLPRPAHFEKMLDCAARLSAPFPFVRVDFYDTAQQLVFGELTFTPSGGLDTGRLPETDRAFGKLLVLPGEKER